MSLENLIQILCELRLESQQVRSCYSEESHRALMKKYDMLFIGSDSNCINSLELMHCINKYFKINVSNDELNQLIPDVCKSCNMSYEALINASDINNPNPKIACYHITLG